MSFNTKHPNWLDMRQVRLGAKFRQRCTACAYCGREMWFTDFENIPDFKLRAGDDADHKAAVATLDHIVPLSQGGPMLLHKNLTAMCITCNEEKGAQDPETWIEELERAGQIEPGRAQRFRKKIRSVLRRMERRSERRNH